jgi:multidrug efflux pump subunit AcrA (membrane-fusion protein)
MNRWIWIVGAAVIIIVALIVTIVLLTRDTSTQTIEVTRGDVEVTIESVGTVAMRDAVQLTAPASTEVEIVSVITGDEVREGDVLIQLDREPFDAGVEAAEDALAQAETALSVLDAGDPPDTAAEIAERVAAQHQVEQAEDALEDAESARSESLVLAPFDGTVIHISVDEGNPIGEGAELIQIAELGEFELIVNIDEVDLPLIDIGASTRIVLEAFPERVIESQIHSIARRAEVVGGTTVFPARVRFQGEDDLLVLPGMNAEVEITADVRRDVLLLPEGSFQTVGRRTFVDVVVNGEIEQREIRTGVRSGGMVEIADGLQEGDQVALP